MATTLFPHRTNQLTSEPTTWSKARNGGSSVVDTVETPATTFQQYITQPDPLISDFVFARSYIQFDLSSIDSSINPITSIRLFVWGNTVTSQQTYIGYSGTSLSRDSNDWTLYLDNINGNNDPLSTVVVESGQYTSCDLDITTYPPQLPPGSVQPFYDLYVIGLITKDDFTNNIDRIDGLVEIDNDANPPYIVINGGYAYNVSGVLGANITTVSGVPSANIANIIGV
jgi:hypothetical protein